jgi:hypothetical protein
MAIHGLSFSSTGRSDCQLCQAVSNQYLSHQALTLGDVVRDRTKEKLFGGTRIARLELAHTHFDRICPNVVIA